MIWERAALLLLCCGLSTGVAVRTASADGLDAIGSGKPMSEQQARGTFEVTLKPESAPAAAVARMSLVKRFQGDLDATSTGEMLAMRTAVEGSAGYVAIERVVGTLGGRHGSFALQHNGIMDRGAPTAVIAVVPDSGTDGLRGLSGSMSIVIEGGQHHYAIRYRLAD